MVFLKIVWYWAPNRLLSFIGKGSRRKQIPTNDEDALVAKTLNPGTTPSCLAPTPRCCHIVDRFEDLKRERESERQGEWKSGKERWAGGEGGAASATAHSDATSRMDALTNGSARALPPSRSTPIPKLAGILSSWRAPLSKLSTRQAPYSVISKISRHFL